MARVLRRQPAPVTRHRPRLAGRRDFWLWGPVSSEISKGALRLRLDLRHDLRPHLEPQGSTYKAVKEEFLSRTPLPLTDAAVGPDGALYFTTGGRGTQSELFRVSYIGTESIAAADPPEHRQADARFAAVDRTVSPQESDREGYQRPSILFSSTKIASSATRPGLRSSTSPRASGKIAFSPRRTRNR